jgi:hypothetical protein
MGALKQTLTENAGADPAQLALEAWDSAVWMCCECGALVSRAPPPHFRASLRHASPGAQGYCPYILRILTRRHGLI